MWELKTNIQKLPDNRDNSHSWSVNWIQAKQTVEFWATPCECEIMSSDIGSPQVHRKKSTEGMKLNFRDYKATAFIALQTPVFQFSFLFLGW